jgi:hypothetical protein
MYAGGIIYYIYSARAYLRRDIRINMPVNGFLALIIIWGIGKKPPDSLLYTGITACLYK